jgi:hypothetical protein
LKRQPENRNGLVPFGVTTRETGPHGTGVRRPGLIVITQVDEQPAARETERDLEGDGRSQQPAVAPR